MCNKIVVEKANLAWNAAFNDKDLNRLVNMYAENAVLSPGNGEALVGHEEIKALFISFIEAGVHSHGLEIIETSGNDNLLYQVAKWHAKSTAESGEITTFGGITSSVLEKDATGEWLVHSHVWNAAQ